MTITYRPKGVCSRLMQVEVEDGIIRKVEVKGGCSGNLQGMGRDFAALGGDAGAAGHRTLGGRALRTEADILPGSACTGTETGAVRREKDLHNSFK